MNNDFNNSSHSRASYTRLEHLRLFAAVTLGSVLTIAFSAVVPNLPAVGWSTPDGIIYAGRSPTTGNRMYTTEKDAQVRRTFDESTAYCRSLLAGGHHDWRVPDITELDILFNNRTAIGNFSLQNDEPESLWSHWYWSSSRGKYYAEASDFRNARKLTLPIEEKLNLRCVRG